MASEVGRLAGLTLHMKSLLCGPPYHEEFLFGSAGLLTWLQAYAFFRILSQALFRDHPIPDIGPAPAATLTLAPVSARQSPSQLRQERQAEAGMVWPGAKTHLCPNDGQGKGTRPIPWSETLRDAFINGREKN